MKSKFKIGDVVVINNPKDSWGIDQIVEKTHGEIGVVVSIYTNYFLIEVEHTEPYSHTSNLYTYNESELINIGEL